MSIPAWLCSQTVTYHIELTARPDSFFLVETIRQPVQGNPRQQEQVTPYLLRDTAELTALRSRLSSEAAEAQKRANEQGARAQLLAAQAAAIEAARQQAFNPTPPAAPAVTTGPPASTKKAKKKPKGN